MVKDEVGQRYGRLTVLERSGSKRRAAAWLCQCDCGARTTVGGDKLRRGETRSCGCGARGGQPVHGHAASKTSPRSPTYYSWRSMVRRCENPNQLGFKYWGGKGVTVCERWRRGDGKRSGFECFLADIGRRPFGLSLDRIDGAGSYEESNCRWTTRIGQARNQTPAETRAHRTRRMIQNDMIGQRFGPLVVVAFVGGVGHRRTVRVRCDCGRTRIVRVRKLASGDETCCCRPKERARVHVHT